jgi:hypothetical protein
MMPRSKQPNDFESSSDSDADQGLEEWDRGGSPSPEAEGDLFLLADRVGEAGAGGGQVVSETGQVSPADFSVEELDLARDLHGLFPLEQEQLPPRFVQTLASQARWSDETAGLVQRVTYRVFQRLHLPRRLFRNAASVPTSGPRGFVPLGRVPQRVALSTVLALVLLSLVTIAPSFAQGLRLLLGQTGVQVVPQYPQTALAPQMQPDSLPLQAVREAVPFTVSWLGLAPETYQFQGLLVHMGQPWADGPVLEFQYVRVGSQGDYGGLVVREFRPKAKATVLQVVAQGAAHLVEIGSQQAIYIDGQWVRHRQAIVWQYGTRAELLYQEGGVIFWITADQRDGVGEALLARFAQNLGPLSVAQMPRMQPDLVLPTSGRVASALREASLGEVIALIPAGISPETGAAVYIALGSPAEDDFQP